MIEFVYSEETIYAWLFKIMRNIHSVAFLSHLYSLVLFHATQVSHLQKFIRFRSSMGFMDNIVAKCGLLLHLVG